MSLKYIYILVVSLVGDLFILLGWVVDWLVSFEPRECVIHGNEFSLVAVRRQC